MFSSLVPLSEEQGPKLQSKEDLAGTDWVNETEERNVTSSPTFKKATIPVNEQSSLVEDTQRLIDDSAFDIEDFVRRNVATSLAQDANSAFISGDGIGKPMGMLSYDTSTADDDSRAWETIQYVKTGQDGDFASSGSGPGNVFLDCLYKMRAPYQNNAVWLMSRSTAAEVRKLRDANDHYYWTDGLQAGQPNTLISYPVLLTEDMPAISTGSDSITLANLQAAYTIPERPGMGYLRDPYTNKPYIRMYFTRRIGGAVVDFNAIKLIRFSS